MWLRGRRAATLRPLFCLNSVRFPCCFQSFPSHNSGYTNGVSSGKGTNATVTISGAAGGAGGVYFSINLTVNSNGTVHVNSITRTGSGGRPYDFDGVRMRFSITGTDGSSVLASD